MDPRGRSSVQTCSSQASKADVQAGIKWTSKVCGTMVAKSMVSRNRLHSKGVRLSNRRSNRVDRMHRLCRTSHSRGVR